MRLAARSQGRPFGKLKASRAGTLYAVLLDRTAARRLAERRSGTFGHVDLYHGLRLVMDHLGGNGCPDLALPALGSDLFNNEFIRDLEGCEIANRAVLDAIRALAFIQTVRGVRRLIDYKNLGSQEWGSGPLS